MIEFVQIIFVLWCISMLIGAMVIMTFMLWVTLRDIFKGEW